MHSFCHITATKSKTIRFYSLFSTSLTTSHLLFSYSAIFLSWFPIPPFIYLSPLTLEIQCTDSYMSIKIALEELQDARSQLELHALTLQVHSIFCIHADVCMYTYMSFLYV